MNVIGLCGYSGSGKTTLAERLIAELRGAGQRVSVVKHAHHAFDIDRPGKDSWRHRQAGAFEVVIASDRRLAKMREFEQRADPTVHDLIAELAACDWVVVEGFKSAALPKIEVWRAAIGAPARYPDDSHVVAVATDDPARLPAPTALPLLDLDDAAAIAAFLLRDPGRFAYRPPGAAPFGVLKLRGDAGSVGETDAAEEVAVAIEVEGVFRAMLRATPADLADLVLGHLLGEGIVATAADLLTCETLPVGEGIMLRAALAPGAAGRARPRAVATVTIDAAALARGMRALAAGESLWQATGASHAAAWVSLPGELGLVREDVGRHNAVDKLIGAMARAGVDPASGFMAVTSRVNREIVAKAARAGIGWLAAISAPTAAAIRLADASGMVLAGFVRGDAARVYSHPERLRRDPQAPR